jgi:hypothetical protein
MNAGVETIFAMKNAPVPRSGTKELSPALQRWVGVKKRSESLGDGKKQVPPLGLKSSVGMTILGLLLSANG